MQNHKTKNTNFKTFNLSKNTYKPSINIEEYTFTPQLTKLNKNIFNTPRYPLKNKTPNTKFKPFDLTFNKNNFNQIDTTEIFDCDQNDLLKDAVNINPINNTQSKNLETT